MSEDYQSRRNKTWARMNAMRHFIFGALMLVLAVFLFQNHRIGAFDFGPAGSYIFGGLLALYGVFRIWRGFADLKKMKEQD